MSFNTRIDRGSYIPYYVQVHDAIKEWVEHSDSQPGDRLPSEPELCRQFDVSRTVIRQALRGLEHVGLIVRHKGRGTFIAEPKIGESLFQELTGFHQDMSSKGHSLVSNVLKQAVIPATAKVANFLELNPGTPVIQVDRVRYVDDEPIVVVTTYLPYSLCPDVVETDLTHQSLYLYLEESYGLVIARGRRVLEAVLATEYYAGFLGVAEGAPLISLESVSYLDDGTPIEYYHALHRGDRSMFEVELIRKRE